MALSWCEFTCPQLNLRLLRKSAILTFGEVSDGPYPQYGWHFPEIPEKFRKDPGNALRVFPGIPVESTAGLPQTLQLKVFEASRAFSEFSPPQYGWGRFFFQKWFRRGPLRAGHGLPSSTTWAVIWGGAKRMGGGKRTRERALPKIFGPLQKSFWSALSWISVQEKLSTDT